MYLTSLLLIKKSQSIEGCQRELPYEKLSIVFQEPDGERRDKFNWWFERWKQRQ